jgi:hypothetical protein
LYSNNDTPKRGLYHDVLAHVYNETREILMKLARMTDMQFDAPLPKV